MDIQPLDIVIYIVNIAVLYALLRVLLYKPVHAFLEKRKKDVEDSLNLAAQTQAQAEAMKLQFDEQLKDVDKEAQKRLLLSTQKASAEAGAIVAAAQKQAQDLVEGAQKKAEEEKRRAITDLQPEISDMAVNLAGEILRREVTGADNQKLIKAFFDKVV